MTRWIETSMHSLPEEKIDNVIYSYLFEGLSYYDLDRQIFGSYHWGYLSRQVLDNFKLYKEYEGIFKGFTVEEAVKCLRKLNNENFKRITNGIYRHKIVIDLFYSWDTLNDSAVLKRLNNSIVEEEILGIPNNLTKFWGIEDCYNLNTVCFFYKEIEYHLSFYGWRDKIYIDLNPDNQVYNFNEIVRNILSNTNNRYDNYPIMSVERIKKGIYKIDFIKTENTNLNNDCNYILDFNNLESQCNCGNFELIYENADIITTSKKNRVGQEKFRSNILKAYNFKCAISGEKCINVLEAAHIQEYINKNSNNIQNGILLREDIHTLFDDGLIAINEDYIIQVSNELESDTYRKFHNKKINLPLQKQYYPSKKSLKNKMNKDLKLITL